jgi:methylamine---glutamate N-methyltransferase subunit A
MCGIVGYLNRTNDEQAPVGCTILSMLHALGCRGPDSTGVAIFGPAAERRIAVRVKLGDHGDLVERGRQVERIAATFGTVAYLSSTGPYLRFQIDETVDPRKLAASIESLSPDTEVVSVGRNLEIVKQVGSPQNLEQTHGISQWRGTHGLGHTRLSTESRVDLSHSQPFWAHEFPDLAIVHNGHITNYHQLRRRYEQHGVRFYTENDSEIIAIYLGEKLAEGGSLGRAFQAMLRDLDGSFSCLAATASEIGFVKDPFAFKPLVFAETDRFVAVATEEIALRAAVPGDYEVREAQVREWRVWQK